MLRVKTDFLGPFVQFEYRMMAPYQSYTMFSNEFVIRGERDGVWEQIDLAPYFPTLRGERSIREERMYRGMSYKEDRRAQYQRMAELLIALEAKQGRIYDRLLIEWWRWPDSPAGYYALQQREFADIRLLYRYP